MFLNNVSVLLTDMIRGRRFFVNEKTVYETIYSFKTFSDVADYVKALEKLQFEAWNQLSCEWQSHYETSLLYSVLDRLYVMQSELFNNVVSGILIWSMEEAPVVWI